MTQLIGQGEVTHLTLDADGNPIAFEWNGSHKIERIWQQWEVDAEWWKERAHRKYYAVTTTDEILCVLYQDLIAGRWYVEKVYD